MNHFAKFVSKKEKQELLLSKGWKHHIKTDIWEPKGYPWARYTLEAAFGVEASEDSESKDG